MQTIKDRLGLPIVIIGRSRDAGAATLHAGILNSALPGAGDSVQRDAVGRGLGVCTHRGRIGRVALGCLGHGEDAGAAARQQVAAAGRRVNGGDSVCRIAGFPVVALQRQLILCGAVRYICRCAVQRDARCCAPVEGHSAIGDVAAILCDRGRQSHSRAVGNRSHGTSAAGYAQGNAYGKIIDAHGYGAAVRNRSAAGQFAGAVNSASVGQGHALGDGQGSVLGNRQRIALFKCKVLLNGLVAVHGASFALEDDTAPDGCFTGADGSAAMKAVAAAGKNHRVAALCGEGSGVAAVSNSR